MEYKDALKKVQTGKAKENLMVIKLDYDTNLVLPYSQGVAFLATLEHAEQLVESYSKPKTIGSLDRSKLNITVMSRTEYEQIKIAALLGITMDEVQKHELTLTT